VARAIDGAETAAGQVVPTMPELRRLAVAVVRGAVVVVALLLSVVGIPWAIRQLVRYQFAPHAVVLEGCDGRRALARSSDLVRGQWWWTAGIVLSIEAAVAIAGFSTAVVVLLAVRSLPLWGFNLIGSLIHVFLVPVGASALTYAYGTVCARAAMAGEPDPDDRPDPALVSA